MIKVRPRDALGTSASLIPDKLVERYRAHGGISSLGCSRHYLERANNATAVVQL